ncbi:hypothetical protein ACFY41_29105 [Streptomyces syringium]
MQMLRSAHDTALLQALLHSEDHHQDREHDRHTRPHRAAPPLHTVDPLSL